MLLLFLLLLLLLLLIIIIINRLAPLVATEVAENRAAAEAIASRSAEVTAVVTARMQPPPLSLLMRVPPGARVRIADGDPDETMRLQESFGGWDEEMIDCLGEEGVVTAYTPAEDVGLWAVEVTCTNGNSTFEWSPANLRDPETGVALVPLSPSSSTVGLSHVGPRSGMIPTAAEDDEEGATPRPGDVVAVDDAGNGSWYAARIVRVNEDRSVDVDAADGQKDHAS